MKTFITALVLMLFSGAASASWYGAMCGEQGAQPLEISFKRCKGGYIGSAEYDDGWDYYSPRCTRTDESPFTTDWEPDYTITSTTHISDWEKWTNGGCYSGSHSWGMQLRAKDLGNWYAPIYNLSETTYSFNFHCDS